MATAANFREHRLFNRKLKTFDIKNSETWSSQFTLLSDEWKHRLSNVPGNTRGKLWSASFDCKGSVLDSDIGYDQTGIMTEGGKHHYAVIYGNVQLREDAGRTQGISRLVKGNQGTSDHSVEAGRLLNEEEMSDSDSSASSEEAVRKETQDEEEHTVTTLFGTRKVAATNEMKRKASGDLSAVFAKKDAMHWRKSFPLIAENFSRNPE